MLPAFDIFLVLISEEIEGRSLHFFDRFRSIIQHLHSHEDHCNISFRDEGFEIFFEKTLLANDLEAKRATAAVGEKLFHELKLSVRPIAYFLHEFLGVFLLRTVQEHDVWNIVVFRVLYDFLHSVFEGIPP